MTPRAWIYAASAVGPNASGPPCAFAASRPGDAAAAVTLRADAALVPLREELERELGRPVPRLISRFQRLALLGAARCLNALGTAIDPLTPLYLGTGLGEVARTDELYYEVLPPSAQMASPARFATSGNNMAAFFVAQAAGLRSKNLTIAADELSFEQALEVALDDLRAQAAQAALVGAVDETTSPREFYERRFPPAAPHPIGEGSAWWVLGNPDATAFAPRRPIGALLHAAVAPPDASARPSLASMLGAVLRAIDEHDTLLLTGCGIDRGFAAELRSQLPGASCVDYLDVTGWFPSAAALALTGALLQPPPARRTIVHVNRDALGRTGSIVLRISSDERPAPRAVA